MFILFRRFFGTTMVLLVAACGSSNTQYYPDPSGARAATAVLAPLANWNPVPGQPSRPGSAAYGRVSIDNGYVDTQQTFEAWTSAGEPIPSGIVNRQRQRQYQQYRRQQYYNRRYHEPRIRYCYNSYTNRQYRC